MPVSHFGVATCFPWLVVSENSSDLPGQVYCIWFFNGTWVRLWIAEQGHSNICDGFDTDPLDNGHVINSEGLYFCYVSCFYLAANKLACRHVLRLSFMSACCASSSIINHCQVRAFLLFSRYGMNTVNHWNLWRMCSMHSIVCAVITARMLVWDITTFIIYHLTDESKLYMHIPYTQEYTGKCTEIHERNIEIAGWKYSVRKVCQFKHFHPFVINVIIHMRVSRRLEWPEYDRTADLLWY